MASSPGLRQSIGRAAADPARSVVVDLSGVTFMDCSGLRPLLEARVCLGDRLWLRGLSWPVARLLHVTDLDDTFPVVDIAISVPHQGQADPAEDAVATEYRAWARSEVSPAGVVRPRGNPSTTGHRVARGSRSCGR